VCGDLGSDRLGELFFCPTLRFGHGFPQPLALETLERAQRRLAFSLEPSLRRARDSLPCRLGFACCRGGLRFGGRTLFGSRTRSCLGLGPLARLLACPLLLLESCLGLAPRAFLLFEPNLRLHCGLLEQALARALRFGCFRFAARESGGALRRFPFLVRPRFSGLACLAFGLDAGDGLCGQARFGFASCLDFGTGTAFLLRALLGLAGELAFLGDARFGELARERFGAPSLARGGERLGLGLAPGAGLGQELRFVLGPRALELLGLGKRCQPLLGRGAGFFLPGKPRLGFSQRPLLCFGTRALLVRDRALDFAAPYGERRQPLLDRVALLGSFARSRLGLGALARAALGLRFGLRPRPGLLGGAALGLCPRAGRRFGLEFLLGAFGARRLELRQCFAQLGRIALGLLREPPFEILALAGEAGPLRLACTSFLGCYSGSTLGLEPCLPLLVRAPLVEQPLARQPERFFFRLGALFLWPLPRLFRRGARRRRLLLKARTAARTRSGDRRGVDLRLHAAHRFLDRTQLDALLRRWLPALEFRAMARSGVHLGLLFTPRRRLCALLQRAKAASSAGFPRLPLGLDRSDSAFSRVPGELVYTGSATGLQPP
jgi:hypothetical protein